MSISEERKRRLEEIKRKKELLEKKRRETNNRKRNPRANRRRTKESLNSLYEDYVQDNTSNTKNETQNFSSNKGKESIGGFEETIFSYSPLLTIQQSIESYDIQPNIIEKINQETQTKNEEPNDLEEQFTSQQSFSGQTYEHNQDQTQTEIETGTETLTQLEVQPEIVKLTQNEIDFQNYLQLSPLQDLKKELVEPEKLSKKDKNQILNSSVFNKFFDYGSRIVERVLNEPFEIPNHVSESIHDEDETTKPILSKKISFYDEKWSKNRSITDLNWSLKHPELMLASYSETYDKNPDEPEGVILLWSLTLPTRPEFVFTCQSQITTAIFSTFQPSIVIGGTNSGKILVWDSRKKETPVMRSSQKHTHPIYGLSIVGSENEHSLVSISNDGRVCIWSLDNLNTPIEILDLGQKIQKQTNLISPTTMFFPENEITSFFVGCENGSIFSVLPHAKKDKLRSEYKGHTGPITGIDFHRAKGEINFSDLYLTSSVDWSINLWSKSTTSPLLTFEESNEYIYDVKWSPIHPSLFVSVNGRGELFVWDFNRDNEEPLIKIKASESAINKCRWSQDGKKIIIGDSEAMVEVFELSEDIAVPKKDDWTRMQEKRINLRPINQKEDQY
ncbi:cytoplasmic dynein 1 intermediate chain-related [Anaeramoeba flamelloides]|uniref:Cytoplasmic dynein 1 intermediate chain-related n=1 Tax=Anaeramoeba flamelloides TaxID=1746091 RepID=A0ABQ8XM90_9EUKA|nr:cytoplasmic dynein 1 intermediate chain-related [Anaeramoeba flamelloides]